jgi:hypothetical protein
MFSNKNSMELLDWIPFDKLSKYKFYLNPNALDYIETHNISKMWPLLSMNPSAVRYLYQDPQLINTGSWFVNENPNVIPFLKKYQYKDCQWVQEKMLANPATLELVNHLFLYTTHSNLCKNTNPLAIELIESTIDQLSKDAWDALSANPAAIHLIEKNMHKVNWTYLSLNPSAVHLLMQHPDRISWLQFSKNTNPLAIEYMKKHLDKVNWHLLSANPSAIELLEQNKDKISWYWFSGNPAIFEYKYASMAKERTETIRDELISIALHPSRVCAWMKEGMLLSDM